MLNFVEIQLVTIAPGNLMDLQPILEDGLVLLRPLEDADFDSLYAVAKDPLIWAQHPAPRYLPDIFADYFKESIASGGALVIIDKSSGQVIGSSRYKLTPDADNAVEIGWSFLSRNYWGGMYNRSVKELMIAHAFTFVDHIVFHIGEKNMRSQKAVEKIGGIRTTEPEFGHLINKSDGNVTYLISKEYWKKGLSR